LMDEKLSQLQNLLAEMASVAVAYSGGVDSSLLLKVAHDVLGERAIALTADSPSMPRSELSIAKDVAARIGAAHVCIPLSEMADERYRANSPERCYFCKMHTYDALIAYAREHGFRYIVDGNNADDLGDYRPGQTAAREQGVRSPFQEVGMTKSEIRSLSHALGLPNWDKPSAACLSSRIPYGTSITLEALAQIERAESFLHQQGFRQVRVRHHGQVARLELEPADFGRALQFREPIIAALKEAGYTYVTMDLSGFRSGSMNQTLASGELRTDGRRETKPAA
jgi:pyridinium-3,5-biscarboxylic acid mononucleotide sulfurtransferase